MLTQFNKHCEDNQLMPDYQIPYKSNSRWETSLVKLVNDILWDFENQNVIALVALDLSVVFDTVDQCKGAEWLFIVLILCSCLWTTQILPL